MILSARHPRMILSARHPRMILSARHPRVFLSGIQYFDGLKAGFPTKSTSGMTEGMTSVGDDSGMTKGMTGKTTSVRNDGSQEVTV
jgi:hypothetical protein